MTESPVSLRQRARDRLIVALDFPSADPTLTFLADLRERCAVPPKWVKVGLQLFVAEGPSLVRILRASGLSVFLDLKLHDIPNTVAATVRAACTLDVDLLTVHATGGPAMLHAAVNAAACASNGHAPRLLAVTLLTSMDEQQMAAVGVNSTPAEQVAHLARVAQAAGIDGLVASPLEAAALRSGLGLALHLVTPGIRSANQRSEDDQQRVASAAAALKAGANQVVVGRPITQASDPAASYDAILGEIERALMTDVAKPGMVPGFASQILKT